MQLGFICCVFHAMYAIIVINTDIVEEDATLREMKQQIEETETMNRLKIWHDHSVLNGHNTFIKIGRASCRERV